MSQTCKAAGRALNCTSELVPVVLPAYKLVRNVVLSTSSDASSPGAP